MASSTSMNAKIVSRTTNEPTGLVAEIIALYAAAEAKATRNKNTLVKIHAGKYIAFMVTEYSDTTGLYTFEKRDGEQCWVTREYSTDDGVDEYNTLAEVRSTLRRLAANIGN